MSYCVLVSERYPKDTRKPADEEEAAVMARLDALARIVEDGSEKRPLNGFELAELDLEQRRAGDLLGLSQSGLPPMRVASLSRPQDQALSLRARKLAEQIVGADGKLDPDLVDLERELRAGWLAGIGAGEVLGEGADA